MHWYGRRDGETRADYRERLARSCYVCGMETGRRSVYRFGVGFRKESIMPECDSHAGYEEAYTKGAWRLVRLQSSTSGTEGGVSVSRGDVSMRSDTSGGGGVADLDELERLLAEATPGPWYELSKVDVSCQRDTGYAHGVRSGAIPQRVLLGYPDSPRELTDIRLVLALHNAAPALIAAARREQEARALIASLVEAAHYVLCCGSWPHDGRRPHAPDCVWGKARAWLAAQS